MASERSKRRDLLACIFITKLFDSKEFKNAFKNLGNGCFISYVVHN